MKIRELKENESLEVIEVTMKPNNTDIFDSVLSDSDTGEYSRIKMRILTDGEIERQTEEISQDINEFYIGENKYQFDVNTLKTKKLYFKNYSYIITYLVSTEYRLFGTIPRKFDIVNDISIYLKNEKDKNALICAKQMIKDFVISNFFFVFFFLYVLYFHLFEKAISQTDGTARLDINKISKNIYTLKKLNK